MSNPLNLNLNLKGVDTSYPALAVGDYRAQIAGYEIKESSKTPGLFMLNIKLETLEPANDAKGKLLDPPFKFSSNLTLPGAPGAEPDHEEMRLKSLASFVDAVFNATAETRPDLNDETLNQLIGKQVIVKIKKSKDDTYGETEVKGFKAIVQ